MSKAAVSKVIMACKLHEVQKNLMGKKLESLSLDYILPLIFEECHKQHMTFWFNFLEDVCVLNLRDIQHENYELNIRYTYVKTPCKKEDIDFCKLIVLLNAFLLTVNVSQINNTSSAKKEETQKHGDKPIQESNIVPPRAIRAAIDIITSRGDKISKKAIEKELNMSKMSIDNRRQCIAYLKDMKE